jgi:hypothetical protein
VRVYRLITGKAGRLDLSPWGGKWDLKTAEILINNSFNIDLSKLQDIIINPLDISHIVCIIKTMVYVEKVD